MSGERNDPPPSIIGFFGKRESSNSLRLMSEEGAFPRGGSSRRFEDKVSYSYCRAFYPKRQLFREVAAQEDSRTRLVIATVELFIQRGSFSARWQLKKIRGQG
jgi:hypothetical protein